MIPTKSDSRRRINSSAPANATIGDYIKDSDDPTEVDGFINEQWVSHNADTENPIPWKTILIIFTLFTGGTICISCATYDYLSDFNRERTDRVWALFIIGALTFIPGGYYIYVLACILFKRSGYTMDDIRRLG